MASNKKFGDDVIGSQHSFLGWEGKGVGVTGGTSSGKFSKVYRRCHEDHPVMKVANGELVGGACNSPRKKFDVYVGLDVTMATHSRSYPWVAEDKRTIRIHFPIRDRGTPVDVESFHSMIDWLCTQLQAGKKVHVGCIGGHGRTGLVIAAIMAKLGEKDAIAWTRKNHCQKAVESDEQVKFLVKEFGVKSATATDRHKKSSSYELPLGDQKPSSVTSHKFAPAPSSKNIWQ